MNFRIACIREMVLISGELSRSVKLRIAVTMLGILEGKNCAAVCTYERGASVFGIGYGWRS